MAQQGGKVGAETVLSIDLRGTSTYILQPSKSRFQTEI